MDSAPHNQTDLISADDLGVVLPDGVVERVARHEARPLRGPHLALRGGRQAEDEDRCHAQHFGMKTGKPSHCLHVQRDLQVCLIRVG